MQITIDDWHDKGLLGMTKKDSDDWGCVGMTEMTRDY